MGEIHQLEPKAPMTNFNHLRELRASTKQGITEKQEMVSNLQQAIANDARELIRVEAKMEQLVELFPEIRDELRKGQDGDLQDRKGSADEHPGD